MHIHMWNFHMCKILGQRHSQNPTICCEALIGIGQRSDGDMEMLNGLEGAPGLSWAFEWVGYLGAVRYG